ncbi:MAG: nucleoside hydrolase [Chloroflexota bacterium]|nr:nucleoside hydrolase [Chloroflexota bacterium]
MARPFLIDTDTASDDAVAILMALRHPDADVKAITVVSGNMPVERGTRNALYTVELTGKDVPVYMGAPRPLTREPAHAEWFHGSDGFGEMNYPPPTRQPASGHAVDAIIDTIRANPGIVLVTLAPLTNIALAVSQAPDIVANVSRCVVMGGAACTVGNVTPAAEYNIWCDPEAARIVFHSGLPIEMVGWELCRGDALVFPDEMAEIRAFGNPIAEFAIDCNRRAYRATVEQSGEDGLGQPDPVAMAIALDPAICTRMSQHAVEIETQSEITRGMTVVDELGVSKTDMNSSLWRAARERGNVSVCWEIDVRAWKRLLYASLKE